MPFIVALFFYTFFGLLFFEIFSVCFPSTVIKRQEGASILCLAGRCGAVVSDFFLLFLSAALCHKEEMGEYRRPQFVGGGSGAFCYATLHF
jgi:hypothetical protein